jgi:hypothetical protein
MPAHSLELATLREHLNFAWCQLFAPAPLGTVDISNKTIMSCWSTARSTMFHCQRALSAVNTTYLCATLVLLLLTPCVLRHPPRVFSMLV